METINITENFTNCINLLLTIFRNLFSKLDSIVIGNTTLLSIYVNMVLIGALIPVILTIGHNYRVGAEKSERIRAKQERSKEK